MTVSDVSYYPVNPWHKFVVSSEDSDGNPLVTDFYTRDSTGAYTKVFTWTQTWNSDGKCTGLIIEVV
jgi:hypothetical protein